MREWSHYNSTTEALRSCQAKNFRLTLHQIDLWLWKSEWLCGKDVTFELLRHWTFLSWLLYKEKKRREKKEDKKNRNSFYKAKFFFSFVLWRYRKQFCNFFNAKYWYIQDWKRFKSSQSSMCLVFAVVNHSHVSYSVDDLLTRTE